MCTISWAWHNDGYDVFFNRDESKLRSKASVPSLDKVDGLRYMSPIDPDGGGSWIVANEYGLTIALLNFYQGVLPKGKLKSRGQIVLGLKHINSERQLERAISAYDLNRFAPFSLFVFDVESTEGNPIMFRWTGRVLQKRRAESPIFSSAFRYDDVAQQRLNLFQQTVRLDGLSRAEQVSSLEAFHHSHEPCPSAYSVCMHREDAQTVSCSHIGVSSRSVTFRYWDGAPCEAQEPLALELDRYKQLDLGDSTLR